MKRPTCWEWMLVVLLLAQSAAAAPKTGDLAGGFQSPPRDARPWVYWFWSDGNITRDGITADLEAMARAGIGGVLIMEVDQGPPKGPARFMSPQWRELFKFVISEARRLGIEINMNNDAGWCGSGGPWNTPEESMQKVVWTETFAGGPGRFDAELTRPQAFNDYYRDIAVIAFPSPAGEGQALADARPKASSSLAEGFDGAALLDGNPATGVDFPAPQADKPAFVQLEFARPYAARRLALTIPVAARQGYTGQLKVSTDGATWKTVAKFNQTGAGAANFTQVKSRFYRVVFSAITTTTLSRLRVCDVNLDTGYRIENFAAKSGMGAAALAANVAPVDPELVVDPASVVDLTGKFQQGRLVWDVPEGRWTVLRIGHTSTGKDNHPAPEEGRGLECDKLSRKGIESQFQGLVEKLIHDSGPESVQVMTYTHIDSWEVGCQNWTEAMREEFKARRGYDLLPYLPAMTGRVVGGAETSERFFWDMRRTISEMLNDYYATGLRELAAGYGMKLSIEAYSGGPFDSLSYSGRCDMPIGEFWTGRPIHASLKPMASGGHIYGNPIIAAEAFTASNTEGRQKNHPGSIKALGDEAFSSGINRFIFHRYSLQPWVQPPRAPGMTMGPWGLEYERTATWWAQSSAWHQYLARCQYLLQQGRFRADLCYVGSEEGYTSIRARQQMMPPVPDGYDYDACAPEAVLTRMQVNDGRLVVEGGMEYRVLVLPPGEHMTPRLLEKIQALVGAGAVVVGEPPLKSPSLSGYPRCDDEVKRLASELWGNCDGKTLTEHAFGKGKVVWGKPLEEVLAGLDAAPDFQAQSDDPAAALHWIHRDVDGTQVYFVASAADRPVDAVCSFRVDGLRPELWHPDTGRIEPAAAYQAESGRVRVPIRLEPSGSVFVVFRPDAAAEPGRVTQVVRDGLPLIDTAWKKHVLAGSDNNASVTGTFTICAWAKPAGQVDLPTQRNSGTDGLRSRNNYLVYPAPGHEVYAPPGQQYATDQTCAGISAGTNGIVVFEHGDSLLAPVLVAPAAIAAKTHIAVVYRDGTPTLYLDGKPARQGLKTGRIVHPASGVRHTRSVPPFQGEAAGLVQINRALDEKKIAELMKETAGQAASAPPPRWPLVTRAKDATISLWVAEAGNYELITAGQRRRSAEAVVASPS
ncbi:MAG: glycosyl hydrolase, partial [Thermoguttaceae bacterium]